MRTGFRLRFLLLGLLLLGSGLAAHASHVLSGDLDYRYIPGSASQYRITVRLYSNPAAVGIPDPADIFLAGSQNGCASSSANNFQMLVPRAQLTNRPLGCAVNGRSYNISQYEATVTLMPGQWTLKVIEENRSGGILNLTGSQNGFYLTAFLDNSSGLTNTSPRFTSLMLPYVCGGQPYRYSFSAFEPDGDSLVYRSVQPMSATEQDQGCGNAIAYAGYASKQFQDPTNGQTATYPAGQFTAGFPLLSFRAVNGVAVPQFDLNTANGDLQTTPVLERGISTVAVQIDEYRRLNGSWTRIGSVMRDVMYSVFDASGNRNPSFISLRVGNTAAQPVDQPIVVRQGQTVSVTLMATDPDAGQAVQISSDVAAVVPGASFQAQGAGQATLSWQVPATLPAGRYFFTITALDDNCPTSGSEVRTISFRVLAQALATTSGRARVLSAYPIPFREQVRFQLPTAGVQPVVITDGLGRVVTTLQSRSDGTVDWSPAAAVPAGAYFARPDSGGYVFRLLRQ